MSKVWHCPGCGKEVRAGQLGDFRTGGAVGDLGRWYVRGTCPHCGKLVQFTKHAASVLAGPGRPGYVSEVVRKKVKEEHE